MRWLASSLISLLCTSSSAPPASNSIQPFAKEKFGPKLEPGVYRFINYGTGTALSVSDTNEDSAVVSMYVVSSVILLYFKPAEV